MKEVLLKNTIIRPPEDNRALEVFCILSNSAGAIFCMQLNSFDTDALIFGAS